MPESAERFRVYGNEIVDDRTGQPISPAEFNARSTTEQKDQIDRELKTRGRKTDQEGEGGSKLMEEADANPDDGDGTTATVRPVAHADAPTTAQDLPEPKTARPSLPHFMEVMKPRFPDVDDRELHRYWAQHYSDIDPKTLPSFETFLPAVKEKNPGLTDHEARAYWDERYGDFGAREKNPTIGERFSNAVHEFGQGFMQVQAGLPKWIAKASEELDAYMPEAVRNPAKAEDRITYKIGTAIEDLAKKAFPTNPDMREDFITSVVPRAIGSMTGFIAGGKIGGAVGHAPMTTAAILGAGSQGAEQYDEAKQFHATDENQRKAFWLGSALGTTEAMPLEKVFHGVAPEVGSKLLHAFTTGGVVGLQEFIQEAGQTVGGNKIAQDLYDANRPLFENAGVSGAAGGVSGAIVGFLTGVLQRRAPHAQQPPMPVDQEKQGPQLPQRQGPQLPQRIGPQQPQPFGPTQPQPEGPQLPQKLGPSLPEALGPQLEKALGPSNQPHGPYRPTVKDVLASTSLDDAIQATQGLINTFEIPNIGGPEKRPSIEPTILPKTYPDGSLGSIEHPSQAWMQEGLTPSPATITPGSAFSPRQERPLTPEETIAAERASVAATGRPRPETQPEPERPSPSGPLQSAADLAHPERGALPSQQDLLLRNRVPQRRPAHETPILPGPEPQDQSGAIEPGQSFTPRQSPELTLREKLQAERLRLESTRTKRPVSQPETAETPMPTGDENAHQKSLPTALDKAYPSVAQVKHLAESKGVSASVLSAIVQQTAGAKRVDDLSPADLQRLSDKLESVKPYTPPPSVQPKPQESNDLFEKPAATAPLPVTEAAKVPRHELAPEQNEKLLSSAEQADHDLTVMGDEKPSLRDFLIEKGGLQDQGKEVSAFDVDKDLKPGKKKLIREGGLTLDRAAELAFDEDLIKDRDRNTLLQAIDDEHRGHGYSQADWYKEATTGPNKLTRDRVDAAIQKIIADSGRDTGKDVEKIKAILLQEQTTPEQPSQPAPPSLGNTPAAPPSQEGQQKQPITGTAPTIKAGTVIESEIPTNAHVRVGDRIRWLGPIDSDSRGWREGTVKSVRDLGKQGLWLDIAADDKKLAMIDGKSVPYTVTYRAPDNSTGTAPNEPFALSAPEVKASKAKAEDKQTSLDIPPETSGSRPIIGREVQPEEAPLFSKAAQEQEAEQASLPEEPSKPEAPPSPTEILAKALRGAADQIEGKPTIQDVGEKIGGARKDLAEKTGPSPKSEKKDDVPGWRKRYSIGEVVSNDIDKGKWIVRDTKDTDFAGRARQVGRPFDTKEDAEAALPLIAVSRKHRVYKSRDGEYAIYRKIGDRKIVQVVPELFKTEEDAQRYMATHPTEILDTKTNFGEEILPTPETVQRVGPDRRNGRNVTAEDVRETFGFRAVEFGNWNNQIERQEVVNHAYDGLLDLAELLKIPAKAMGLNGELALAFGARGQGLSGARAHYERTYGVINLTKMQGAGSLAHEWFHAADHYFGRQDTKASSEKETNERGDLVYKTKGTSDYASHGFLRTGSQVRPEVRDAYTALIQTMFTKAEQYVEDAAKVEKFVGEARQQVEDQLKTMRDSEAYRGLSRQLDTKYHKRHHAPATAEQLAAFDAIAQRILDGELFEDKFVQSDMANKSRRYVMSGRWSNDAIEKISAIYKAVRGRSGFDSQHQQGIMDKLRMSMKFYSARLKMLAEAQKGNEKTKQVPTSYAMEAKSLDQGRAEEYWMTPHEMAARAFSAYVEDKLKAEGKKSDFITYQNFGAVPTPWGWKKPYPEGEERRDINASFDLLVDRLKTKETDKGTALFSQVRADGLADRPLSEAELNRLTSRINVGSKTGVRVVPFSGLPQDVQEEAEAQGYPANEIRGVFHQGQVYLVHGNIATEAQAEETIFHELYHAWVSGLLGDQKHASLSDLFQKIGGVETVLKLADKYHWDEARYIIKAYGARTDLSLARRQSIITDELLATLGQRNAHPGLQWWWKEMVGAVRSWLRDHGFATLAHWNESDLAHLLKRARQADQHAGGTATFMVGPSGPLAPTFYSHALHTLEQKMPNKAGADQINGMLSNGGVKADELKWIGLDDYLKTKDSHSKEDVLNFVRQNQVQVQEVTKGMDTEEAKRNKFSQAYYDRDYSELNAQEQLRIRQAVEGVVGHTGDETKFAAYQLPGGTDYRELLLTLPSRHKFSVVPHPDGNGWAIKRPDGSYMLNNALSAAPGKVRSWDSKERAEKYGVPAHDTSGFHSSHFSEPNILAHVRFNTRTVDGKKVLFLEEVQSDWHQAGRKKGYQSGKVYVVKSKGNGAFISLQSTREAADRIAAQHAGVVEEQDRQPGDTVGVPDAPFKKTWHELALRRMIRYAAEHGYDSLAWTTGDQQAERYDLSKHVDSVQYNPDSWKLTAYKDKHRVIDQENVKPDQLEEFIGKDAADKLLSQAPTPTGLRAISGLDLKVGGSGMKGFYDSILPAFLNKYGKKWGAQVGTIELPGAGERTSETSYELHPPRISAPVHALPITDAMKQSVLQEGQPLFQRVSPLGSSTGLIDKVQAKDRLAAATTKARPYLLGSLGLHQLATVYGKDHQEVANYNRASQKMETDFVEITRESDEILQHWDKLKANVADRMARVMEQARFANYDPDPQVNTSAPDDPKEQAVRDAFNNLPDEAKAVYREARDFYSKLADRRFEAIAGRIERSGGTPENRRAALDKLKLAYDRVRAKVYFPFTRFGEHIVIAKQMVDGVEKDREVSAFESPLEAQQFATMMKARGWKVKQTLAKEYSRDQEGAASKAVREILNIVEGIDEETPQAKAQLLDAINQTFINALPDMSYAKHFTHAKDVKGFSKDALRAFAHSALHGAHHISRIQNADHLTRALATMDERINKEDEGDVTEARQVHNELTLRHNDLLNPNVSPVTAWLGQLGFTMSLGGVIATGVTNATQVPLVTLPWLGARYGFGKAGAHLARAYKDFLDPATLNADSLFDASQSKRVTEGERAMLKELQRRGRIDLTQTMDLSGRASQDNLSRVARQHGSIQDKIAKMLGFTFHAPEVMNRQVTALATYRMEMTRNEPNETPEQKQARAINQAEEAIIDTHFIYTQENRPRYMSGNVMRVLTMFKQYGQNIAFLYGRSAQLWLTKTQATAEEKAIAKKQLLSMAGLQFAAAGALGMPFVGTVASLFTALLNGFGDDDDKKDWEVELRKYLAEAVGKDAGEVLSHGASRLTPWDMSARLGQADLFFRAPQREREGRAAAMDWITSLSGPVLGYAVNAYLGVGDVAKGIQSADSGHFLRGVEEMTPALIRNQVKALRFELEGGIASRDHTHQLDVTGAEKLGQFFGFAPSRGAEMYEGMTAIKNHERHLAGRRADLLDAYAAAYEAGDYDRRMEITAEIREFNVKHRELAINGDTLMKSLRGRKKREAATVGGVYLPKKRDNLRQEGNFANY